MGCDGGTIPKRHELVRTKKKPEEKDKEAELAWKWQYCALSNQMLKDPIVACELGRLYNKDAVIEYLLDKDDGNKIEKMNHIKGLKDLHALTLQLNPDWEKEALKGDAYIDVHKAKYICPVAGIEMNGKYRFCYLLTCNCVLSEKALKQVRGSNCPSCSKEYLKEDSIIILNGSEEEEAELRAKMVKRKEAAKSERKKSKKDKKNKSLTNTDEKAKSLINGVAKTNGHSRHDVPSTSADSHKPSTVKNLATANTVKGAKHKLQEEKIFQTDAFKSLFTSHSSAKRAKDKNGHWITYNPYHYAG